MRVAALSIAFLAIAATLPAQQIDERQVRKGLRSISSAATVTSVKNQRSLSEYSS